MKVLIACEFSGRVRDAFLAKGYNAVSCDLFPSEGRKDAPHYQGSVLDILDEGWDLMIAFPPCTHLCASGARWWRDKQAEQAEAIAFVQALRAAPIPKIAIENPVGLMSSILGPATQFIEPYWFGDAYRKKTGLWLFGGLPRLKATHLVPISEVLQKKIHHMPDSKNRAKKRSLTPQGLALAMAEQWG